MKVRGSYIFHHSKQRVRQALTNPDTLAVCLPGVEQLVPDGENRFRGVFGVGIGPVRGRFEGWATLNGAETEGKFEIRIQALGPTGSVDASGELVLTEHPQGTQAYYEGEVRAGGVLGAVGDRFLGSVAQTLIHQFFANLEKKLKEEEVS